MVRHFPRFSVGVVHKERAGQPPKRERNSHHAATRSLHRIGGEVWEPRSDVSVRRGTMSASRFTARLLATSSVLSFSVATYSIHAAQSPACAKASTACAVKSKDCARLQKICKDQSPKPSSAK